MINFLDEIIEPISENTSNIGGMVAIISAVITSLCAVIAGIFAANKNNKGDK